jgi:hypothetical protein
MKTYLRATQAFHVVTYADQGASYTYHGARLAYHVANEAYIKARYTFYISINIKEFET